MKESNNLHLTFSSPQSGEISIHLRPTFELDIVFDKRWNMDSAKVDGVADGWVPSQSCGGNIQRRQLPVHIRNHVGADLYARAETPSSFGWKPRSFPIACVPPKSVKKGDTCPGTSPRLVRRIEPGAISTSAQRRSCRVYKQHIPTR